MKILDLTQRKVCSAGIGYEDFIFPGGEVHIRLRVSDFLQEDKGCRIVSRCSKSSDFMKIILAVNALHHIGAEWIELFLPYFPYARQDRVVNPGDPFSLEAICGVLKSLNLNQIITYDLHSQVAVGLLANLKIENNDDEVDLFLSDINKKDLLFVSPDMGATGKTFVLSELFPHWCSGLAVAEKVRDTITGKIKGVSVDGDVKGRDCLIVDDICDGGTTFIELAKVLKQKGANGLYLFVSHGIFSKGLKELFKYYNSIGTTDSFRDEMDFEMMRYYDGFDTVDKFYIYILNWWG